jgi:hypothetical protein
MSQIQEGAGLRGCMTFHAVLEQVDFIRVDPDFVVLPGIPVYDQELPVPFFFNYPVYQAHMSAAFAASRAFDGQEWAPPGESLQNINAREGIRTPELLRDWTLNPAPLTRLGNPRTSRSHLPVTIYPFRLPTPVQSSSHIAVIPLPTVRIIAELFYAILRTAFSMTIRPITEAMNHMSGSTSFYRRIIILRNPYMQGDLIEICHI